MNAWTGVFSETGAWQVAATGLAAAAAISFATWVASLVRRDASLIDRSWSLMILAASLAFVASWTPTAPTEPRTTAMLWVMAAWALRLSAYVTWRNWGHGEDRRYQAIRARNQPNFALKSLVYVFALQAVLAWIVALPALAAAGGGRPFGAWDVIGLAIAIAGLVIEATSDAQMARFKADPAHRGQVMDRGWWRYSRHPNYFGECVVWWGLGLVGLASGGGAWCLLSPLLMTVLLLKVSGVALLEKDIGERRPAYRDYIARTNAFVPGLPREKDPS